MGPNQHPAFPKRHQFPILKLRSADVFSSAARQRISKSRQLPQLNVWLLRQRIASQ
jgi:hypothetical protein